VRASGARRERKREKKKDRVGSSWEGEIRRLDVAAPTSTEPYVDGFTERKQPRIVDEREEEVIGSSVTEVYLAGREREGKRGR